MWEFTPPLAKLLQNGAQIKGYDHGHEPLSQNVAEAAAVHHHWRPMLLYTLTSRDQLASTACATRESFTRPSNTLAAVAELCLRMLLRNLRHTI